MESRKRLHELLNMNNGGRSTNFTRERLKATAAPHWWQKTEPGQ